MNQVAMQETASNANELMSAFARNLNGVELSHFVKDRADGPYLIIQVVQPSEHLFRALREAKDTLSEDHPFKERATIQKRGGTVNNHLQLPEVRLLKAVLSESLTVDQHTFGEDFFGRYIRSVFDYEDQIVSEGNYLVYGRRGSGKSSLLAYAMHHRQQQGKPYAWVAMQAYDGRNDIHASTDITADILRQLCPFLEDGGGLSYLAQSLEDLSSMKKDGDAEEAFKRLLPRIARTIGDITGKNGEIVFFIDDFHLLHPDYQPRLLGHLYSISRGNRCHLKISGIEQFSRPWSSAEQVGLESPHDAQVLKLDYNLTMPEKSKAHIKAILDAHARFCGLPSIVYISSPDALARLVWVAAAVPRDALHLFSQAITRAASRDQKAVSITSINLAASEVGDHKLRDVERNHCEKVESTRNVFERLKAFCTKERRQNAFLVEIKNDDEAFRSIQDLIALRLVHVLHEGITPHEAARRYQALMLDYGFYVGTRAARSVDLFHQKNPKTPSAKDLRNLPIFQPEMAAEVP